MDKETGLSQMEEMEVTSSADHQSSVKESPFDNAAPRRRSLRQKLKAHLKRWWWLQLILFIAITLLIVLILVYVAFPKIAQSDVDGSTLSVSSLVISNPTETSFHLHQISTITSSSAYHPQLDAFNASLSLVGSTPYAYITIPALVAAATTTATVDQDVQITDLAAFTAYNVALLNNAQVQMAVQGNTGLHEMAFPETNVNYDKIVTMNGLNKLTGFAVTSFAIKLIPDPDGTNMVGTVSIPNPSPITIAMGNVTMNVYNQGVFLGTSTLLNLTLSPGNNSVPMTSITNQTQVLTLITEQYKDGLLPIDIIGNSSVYNGVHLTYFEEALASVTQHITLDVGSALKAVGVNLTSTL